MVVLGTVVRLNLVIVANSPVTSTILLTFVGAASVAIGSGQPTS